MSGGTKQQFKQFSITCAEDACIALGALISGVSVNLEKYKEYASEAEVLLESNQQEYCDMIEQELPDEILFFHLSRRLKGCENEISYNLQELLTSNNSFSEFLKAHQITFRKGAGNRIILCYRDRQISLKNTMNTDVCYLRSRLGYNSGREDFCFNGFAFRDLLMKNQYPVALFKGICTD